MKKWMIALAGTLLLIVEMLAITATASEINGRESNAPQTESAILTDGATASNRMSVESRRTDTGYAFDLALTGSMRGQILGALYGRDGQLLLTQTDNASSHCEFTFEDEETAGYAKFMWIDENHKPLCGSVRTDLPAVAVYSKPLEEEHIAEGQLSYEGETVSTLYVDNEILLEAKEGVTKEQIERLVNEYGGSVVGEIPIMGHYQIELRNASGLDDLNGVLSALADSPLLESASPNPVMEMEFNSDIFTPYYPTDPWEGASWNEGYPADKNWGLEAINVLSAWQMLMNRYGVTDDEAANGDFRKIPKINIGIIDSMFDTQHPDLRFDHIYGVNGESAEVTGNTRNLALRETEQAKYDNYSHGTHVAGTIAAIHNRQGISGISLNHSLSAVSCIRKEYVESTTYNGDKCYFSLSNLQTELGTLICGNPMESAPRKVVINCSMGHPTNIFDKAMLTRGLKKCVSKGYDFLFVASAGNNEDNAATKNSVFTAIDDPDVASRIIVVGAAWQNGEDYNIISSQENKNYNYGDRIDVAAPGDKILSSVPLSAHFGAKEYQEKTGTSMAAPHVTGVAALIWEANPELSGNQVKDILISTADIELSNVTGTGRHGTAIDNGKTYPRYMINAAHAVADALKMDYVIQGQCGKVLSWKFDRNTHALTISGEGAMTDFQESEIPWYRYRKEIEAVTLNNSVVSVGDYAFVNFTELNQVTWSDSLRKIGNYAFFVDVEEKGRLRTVPDLPPEINEIGENAFPSSLAKLSFGGNPPNPVSECFIANFDAAIYYPGYNEEWQKAAQDNGDGTYTWNGYKAFPTPTLNGVVWEKGLTAPISGVTVNCVGPSTVQHTTAADGSFKFENLKAGTYTVTFRKSGYQDVTRTLKLESGMDVLWNAIQMEREVTKPEKYTLRGTVTARNSGAAVSGASLVVYKGRLIIVTAPVQEDGSFSISLTPGDYTIEVWCDGYEKYQETVTIAGSERMLTIPLTKVQSSEPWMEWTFDETTGTLTITGSGPMEDYSYNSIRRPPWSGNRENVKHIRISGMASIGNHAFYCCKSLISITILGDVASVGRKAFYGCNNLTSVTIPSSVTSIGDGAFYDCNSLTSVTIPNSVTSIGNRAFCDCSSLTSVTLSNSITSIGDKTFSDCYSLISIMIPNGVASIGASAFYKCFKLTSITIPNSVTSIGADAFAYCGVTSVTIPNSVTSIGEGAFEYCSVTSVAIPNSVTSIGDITFRYCSSLTSVTIPNSVTSIGLGAFAGCKLLSSVTIPNSVTSIGEYAFEDCEYLTSVTIPNSVTSIGTATFRGCIRLTSVTIPNSVTSIEEYTFASCRSLTSATLPNSIVSIGYEAFWHCESLTSIFYEGTEEQWKSVETGNAWKPASATVYFKK